MLGAKVCQSMLDLCTVLLSVQCVTLRLQIGQGPVWPRGPRQGPQGHLCTLIGPPTQAHHRLVQ